MKTILSLCDLSGEWPRPYLEAGYNVVTVDLQNGGDVRLLHKPSFSVHGILAAPPCTVFAASGARWPRSDADMIEGLSVVDACLRLVVACQPKWWALENPIGKLVRYLGKPIMYFNPCDYAGHADNPQSEAYTKRTALWGSFNTNLPQIPVEPVLGSKMLQYGGKSMKTKNSRSKTPEGFARAFFQANP